MTRYERIRQEIIAIERKITMLHHVVKDSKDQEAYKKIYTRNARIRDSFSDVSQSV